MLTLMFRLGLFENRYVNEDRAAAIIGRADFAAAVAWQSVFVP